MFTELVVFSFPTPTGAKNFLRDLMPLHDEHLIRLEDAAIAAKDSEGRLHGKVRTDMAAHGLVSGSLWGTLTGALFLEPFLGFILGGMVGLFTGGLLSQARSGISTRLVKRTAQQTLEPNCSALFLLLSKLTPDKVAVRMRDHDATIVRTSLSIDKERRLRQAWRQVREDGPLALHADKGRGPKTQLLPESNQ